MNKLLAANLMRIKKNKIFWGCVIFMAGWSIIYPITRYFDMTSSGYNNPLEAGYFMCALWIPSLLSVFCSLFTGTEYSDGTIRNKMAVGHTRLDIYLSSLISNMIVSLILSVISFVVYFCVGCPLMGFFKADLLFIILYMLAVIILSFAFTSIFTMIGMIVSSKANMAVICIISTLFFVFVGTYLNARLNEPEYYPSYVMSEHGSTADPNTELIKNPRYLVGTERDVYEFLHDFLPGGQIMQCTTMESETPHLLMAYSTIIFVVTTATGILVFKRKDVK